MCLAQGHNTVTLVSLACLLVNYSDSGRTISKYVSNEILNQVIFWCSNVLVSLSQYTSPRSSLLQYLVFASSMYNETLMNRNIQSYNVGST